MLGHAGTFADVAGFGRAEMPSLPPVLAPDEKTQSAIGIAAALNASYHGGNQ
jgi:hypothetical protein